MDSILKPLAKKVNVFTDNIGVIARGLGAGDPEAKKRIDGLWKDLANFYQDCQSGYAAVYASWNNAISTAQGAYNPSPMIKMIVYYIGEVMAAIQLITGLIKLIASVLSISTLLQFFMADIIAIQKALNTAKLWMIKAIERAKQKLMKNIEWIKRKLAANFNKIYLKAQLKAYEAILEQLKSKLPSLPAPKVGLGGNGTYINGVFVYFDKASTANLNAAMLANSTARSLSSMTPAGLSSASSGLSNSLFANTNLTLPSTNTLAASSSIVSNVVGSSTNSSAINSTISAANAAGSNVSSIVNDTIDGQIKGVKTKITSLTNSLKAAEDELNINIPKDKEYWTDLWKKQAEQDKKDLLSNIPKLGVNI